MSRRSIKKVKKVSTPKMLTPRGTAIQTTAARRRARAEAAEPPSGLVEAEEDVRGTGRTLRRSDCETYSVCLDYATARGWDNFSCAPCTSYWPTAEVYIAASDITRSVVAQRRAIAEVL